MSDLVRKVTLEKAEKSKKSFPRFRAGDTVGVYVRVREGEKERIQLYRGMVIKIQGSGMGRSFTVRKISSGVGVERTFPFKSPAIDRVELISQGNVRRGKLLYLRDLKGNAARIESDLYTEGEAIGAADELPAEPVATAGETPEKTDKTEKAE